VWGHPSFFITAFDPDRFGPSALMQGSTASHPLKRAFAFIPFLRTGKEEAPRLTGGAPWVAARHDQRGGLPRPSGSPFPIGQIWWLSKLGEARHVAVARVPLGVRRFSSAGWPAVQLLTLATRQLYSRISPPVRFDS